MTSNTMVMFHSKYHSQRPRDTTTTTSSYKVCNWRTIGTMPVNVSMQTSTLLTTTLITRITSLYKTGGLTDTLTLQVRSVVTSQRRFLSAINSTQALGQLWITVQKLSTTVMVTMPSPSCSTRWVMLLLSSRSSRLSLKVVKIRCSKKFITNMVSLLD